MKMRLTSIVVCIGIALAGSIASALPPASQPATVSGIDHLRDAVKAAYNKGDLEGMLAYLHPDAVIIFPDGRILKGRAGLRDYYNRMLKAPDHIVASFTAEPEVQSRTVHGDVGLSYGLMNDQYVLTNGKSFKLDSRFTVTLFKSADGPADTDGWMVRSFHASTDAFDNAVMKFAIERAFWIAGVGGLLAGVFAALILGRIIARRRRQSA